MIPFGFIALIFQYLFCKNRSRSIHYILLRAWQQAGYTVRRNQARSQVHSSRLSSCLTRHDNRFLCTHYSWAFPFLQVQQKFPTYFIIRQEFIILNYFVVSIVSVLIRF